MIKRVAGTGKIGWILLAICITAKLNAQQAKNILIIYTDDQSYNTIQAWGNHEIKTPNLDRLAAQGLSFRQTHVMGGHQGAVCIPSRIMMLTGRYINRLPRDGSFVPDSLVSLPEVLRRNGYTTFHTGKWHSDKLSHDRFFSAGDNIFFGGMHFEKDGGQFHPYVYHYDGNGTYPANAGWKSDTFSTQLYTDAAIRFLAGSRAKEKPFLCYVAFTSPHDPRTPPPSFTGYYDPENISLPPNFLPEHPFDNGDLRVRDEMLIPHPRTPAAVKEQIALYYAMVSELDAQVGRILDALDENGLRENTLVIFAGDNGLAVGQHGLLGKQSLYEHSIRVPMIFSGPSIPVNKQTNAFVYLSDITPTILDWLDIPAPSTVEAKSLLPLIKDQKATVRKNIYNVYGHWSRSIKCADGYKLIVYNVNGISGTQLFNLRKDPWEIKNLAGNARQAKRVQRMKALLKREMQGTHDDLNIDLPDWGRKPEQKASGS
ncbi:MAG TPA: sulfatase-like hydrolase/transferase [Agriterribacter sp.]|nr:sulfatase-like hydrolase/transferase [Agriterribacter sp.]